MKKSIYIGFLLISIVLLLTYMGAPSKYPISNNKEDITKAICTYIRIDNIHLQKSIDIKNVKEVLFIHNNTLGEAELVKGLNGNYKIKYVGQGGSNSIITRVVKIKDASYLVVRGKNINNKIAYLTTSIEGKLYKLPLQQGEYFMEYCLIDTDKEIDPVVEIQAFDRKNNNITKETLDKDIPL